MRIFEREARSLADSGEYEVHIAGAGVLPNDTPVRLLPLPPRPTRRVSRFTRGPYDAWKFARTHDFDIWHFHDPEALPVAIWLARRGKTVIWDAHEDYSAEVASDGAKSWVPGPLRGITRSALSRLLTTTDNSVAAVVAATDTISSRYRNPRTVVVGNEARLSDFADCAPTFTSRQVLFTGSPTDGHCFPQLISALESLPDVTLAVAGHPPDEAVWADATRRLGPRVRHVGWLDRAGLSAIISKASVGLVLYSDTAAHAVNAGNKLFEFVAAGLPIVATPTLSNRRYLADSHGGVIADDFSPSGLRIAIAEAFSDRGRWEDWASAGRSWALSHGSWEASERRLLDLYADLTAAD